MAIEYKPGGITLTVGKREDVSLPPGVFRARLTCMHFDTNKCFLLPMSMPGVKAFATYYQRHPGMTVLVTGHTDLVGTPEYNLVLSDERAQAVAAYLRNDVDAWLPWYEAAQASKRWSHTEDQHMLATVTDAAGQPYYAGAITGSNDAATQEAVKRFQTDSALKVDGISGPNTRRALIGKYMDIDGTTLPPDAKLETHGCGESHPVDANTGADIDNRRVEIFLFDGPVDPPAPATCPPGGCIEYPEWVRRTIETHDLGDGEVLVVKVEDTASPPNPIANAEVTVSGADASQRTDASGCTTFVGLAPGNVHVVAKAGGAIGERDAVVGSGGGGATSDSSSLVSGTGAPSAPAESGGPVVVPIDSPRLRMSLFDFNPSFIKSLKFTGSTATGVVMDATLLDAFQAARIDDYSLVRTISFTSEDASHNAAKPSWSGLSPGGSSGEALRVDYLQQLANEMHNRNAQVLAGYEVVERGTTVSEKGKAFRAWLAAASTAQVTTHAQDIVDFFVSRSIPIDGIGFDIELNGFGQAHAANVAVLFNETAKAFAAARPGAFVYYDTAPFRPNDGEGSSSIIAVLKYALANGAGNLIARPMCYNGTVIADAGLRATIECALRSASSGGGGLAPSKVQYAIDVSRTPDATVKSFCTDILRANLVGMTIYTMPGGGKSGFLTKAAGWEAALNPGSPPPGTSGQPLQVPVP